MCVDDYQFRHFSALRPKICRKFVFVNEEEFAKTGDRIIITAGVPLGTTGATNMLRIAHIGDVR